MDADMPSRRIWWALILLAGVLRLVHAPLATLHHADELWQYLEPAWHLTGGDWVQSWEWREGTRSWLIPALLAGPMALGKLVHAHILLPRLVMIAFSLIIVASAIRLGARFSRRHAILAGFVAATWFELVYFAPRTLSEPLGVALFLGAAALLLAGGERSRARLALAGVLLGATVMVRFQFAPAVAVLGCAALFRDVRRGWPLIAGGAVACGVAGLIDLSAGQMPYRWIWNSFHQNIVINRSADFGVSGPLGYIAEIAPVWSWTAILLLPLAIAGARRYPVLMAAAIVNLAVHTLIPHKEYRFVLLTTVILVLLAAIAMADLIDRLGRQRDAPWRKRALCAAMAAWLLASIVTGGLMPFARNWGSHGAMPRAFILSGQVRDVCGLATIGVRHRLSTTWAFYGRQTPMMQFYGASARADGRGHAGAFNVMIAPYGSAPPDPRFVFLGCSEAIRAGRPGPDYCVWRRPGQCTAPAPPEFHPSAVMKRLGN